MKYVYSFNEGSRNMQELLGAKGQKLSDMNKMGLPVPFGFIITNEAARKYYEEKRELDPDVKRQILEKLFELQELTGKGRVVLNDAVVCDAKELIDNIILIYNSNDPGAGDFAELSKNTEMAIVVQEELGDFEEEVVFTRDPETGEKNIENQVSSVMRAFDISKVASILEKQFKAVQKVSFAYVTQDDATEKMYVISTENAKLSYYSEIKTAVDLVDEGVITKLEAVKNLDASLFPRTDKILEGSSLDRILSWADDFRTVKIRSEIKSINDVKLAKGVGSDGIGYYDRLDSLRRSEFSKIYDKVEDYDFSIRLSDCKRAVVNPDVVSNQAKEIFTSAIKCAREKDINVKLELVLPIAGTTKEMKFLVDLINSTARKIFDAEQFEIPYFIAALIETPRAAINASEISKYCDTIIFDIARLTENSFGLSERSVKGVTEDYVIYGLLDDDPIKSIDEDGVGKIIDFAIAHALITRPKMKFGLIGPQTIAQETIKFAKDRKIAYITCKIYDVPKARIIAAQAGM